MKYTSIKQANYEDLKEIFELQKLAFQGQAKIYNDYTITPLIESLDDLQTAFHSHSFLKYVNNGKIIGSVRCFVENDICHIGRLIVHPDYQNKGIGTILMHEIENIHANCSRFELFTGHKSERNLHLYKKLGYKFFKQEDTDSGIILIYLRK